MISIIIGERDPNITPRGKKSETSTDRELPKVNQCDSKDTFDE